MDKKLKYSSGIYEIVNLINGKKYIGSAVNLRTRKHCHYNRLRSKKHHSPYLQNSYNKNGENNFRFNVMLFCNKKDLIFYEQRLIDCYGIDKLYNTAPVAGSCIGVIPSKDHRQKISIALKGRKRSKETRLKMSKAKKGSFRSKEHRLKLSMANKGKTPSAETRLKISYAGKGRVVTQETRNKIGKSNTGKTHSNETKLKLSIIAKTHPGVIAGREKARLLRKGEKLSKDHRGRISLGNKGKKRSKEQKLNYRKAWVKRKQLKERDV